MFSVIIPLYNKAPYIEKALQSVLQQTFRDFEIIVVDDGSTDNGAEIVKKVFSTDYLMAHQLQIPLKGFQLISQPNQGVSTARNNGVKAAQENYLAFLDADDEWHPEYLAKMKQLIEQFPDAGLWASSYYIVKNGRNRLATVGVEKDFSKGIINYFQTYAKTLCMPVWTGAAIVPKKVFEEEHGFKPQLKLGEDFDLWVRIAIKHPVAFLNEPLAYYHQDVEQKNRGVVDNKIYEPATHYIFNLQFLEQAEKENTDLKQLMDNLRVYTLNVTD
jgi:glycosyltransferase involved in cell wall biosynthesis